MATMRWKNILEGWNDDRHIGLQLEAVITLTLDTKEVASHTNKIIDYRRAAITILRNPVPRDLITYIRSTRIAGSTLYHQC